MIAVVGLAIAANAGAGSGTFPASQVADMVYEMALAGRTVYTRDLVQRLADEESVISASEHYDEGKGLPLPAQNFSLVAEEIETNDYWLSLRSLTPINFANNPLSPMEEEGLAFVAANPGKAFYAEAAAGQPSLVAIDADAASVPACVACHNSHPESPRRDFELGDVMGGVVVGLFTPE